MKLTLPPAVSRGQYHSAASAMAVAEHTATTARATSGPQWHSRRARLSPADPSMAATGTRPLLPPPPRHRRPWLPPRCPAGCQERSAVRKRKGKGKRKAKGRCRGPPGLGPAPSAWGGGGSGAERSRDCPRLRVSHRPLAVRSQ